MQHQTTFAWLPSSDTVSYISSGILPAATVSALHYLLQQVKKKIGWLIFPLKWIAELYCFFTYDLWCKNEKIKFIYGSEEFSEDMDLAAVSTSGVWVTEFLQTKINWNSQNLGCIYAIFSYKLIWGKHCCGFFFSSSWLWEEFYISASVCRWLHLRHIWDIQILTSKP